MSTDALLWHALSEVLTGSDETNRDPIKNVYYDETNEFDHIHSFQFLEELNHAEGSINVLNIQNAASLYAIMILGDEMGVFRVADSILKYVSTGRVDVESTTTATRLYNYMQLRDKRTSFEERAMWYKQVFDIGAGETTSDMVSNDNFMPLWENLMSEVIKYIGKYEKVDDPLRVSRSGINQVMNDLQHNLSRATSGMVKIFIPEMYAHLEDAIQIINAEELKDQLGHGISKDLWNVIESISADEFNYVPNTSSLRTIAETARSIMLDVADYDKTIFNNDKFQKMVRNVEAFVIAQNQLRDGTLSHHDEADIEDIDAEFETMEEDWDF